VLQFGLDIDGWVSRSARRRGRRSTVPIPVI